MVSCFLGLGILAVLGSVGAHGGSAGHDPDCPRHRGLPQGLSRGNNTIRQRALYRIDLRHALKGYTPDAEYKFRVHTTARKMKFNDATIMVDAWSPECGAGTLLVRDDTLYSPQGCPDVVTTQQKLPMGRAHFRWRAPSCGCVHIRVRVHANSYYYLEDSNVHNGALARTVCPKDVFEKMTKAAKAKAKTNKSKSLKKRVDPRLSRLESLCTANEKTDIDAILKGEAFLSKRHVQVDDAFQLDRLYISLAQRKASTSECCEMDDEERMECFDDVRRRRIDTFCGVGEPDIPFSKARYEWITQRKTDCCWQIGESRYDCFNYTQYREAMQKDNPLNDTDIDEADLDDFDPANDVDDFTTDQPPTTTKSSVKTRTVTSSTRTRRPKSGNKRVSTKRQQQSTTTKTVVEDVNSNGIDIDDTNSAINETTGDIDDESEENLEITTVQSNRKASTQRAGDTKQSSAIATVSSSRKTSTQRTGDNKQPSTIAASTTRSSKQTLPDDDDDDLDDDLDDDIGDDSNEEVEPEEEDDENNKKSAIIGTTSKPSRKPKQGLDKESDDEDLDAGDQEEKKSKTDFNPDRSWSDDECCWSGIWAGTKIAPKSFDGCFNEADGFNTKFNNWDRRCDRRFVMCCMVVIDGESLTNKLSRNVLNRFFLKPPITTTVVHTLTSFICGKLHQLTNKHACKKELQRLYNTNIKHRKRHRNDIGISRFSSLLMSKRKSNNQRRKFVVKDKHEHVDETVIPSRFKSRHTNLVSEDDNEVPGRRTQWTQILNFSDDKKDNYSLNEVEKSQANSGNNLT